LAKEHGERCQTDTEFPALNHQGLPNASDTELFLPAPDASATVVPVPSGKWFACRTVSQGFKGQDQRDQMQL
jgi:hypothetical protein